MSYFKDLIPDISLLDYVRVAAAVPKVAVGDVDRNVIENINLAISADEDRVDIVAFPELSLTGYTCKDEFLNTQLIRDAYDGLIKFCFETKNLFSVFIVGLPWSDLSGRLLNVAAVVYRGKVLAFIPKSYVPNYGEFEETRWFLPALGLKFDEVLFNNQTVPMGTDIVINHAKINCRFGVEICEDAWMKIPPSCLATASGAQLIFNLSASNELVGKDGYRRDAVVNPQSARCVCGYIYVSAGQSESTSGTVFGGHCLIAENGSLIAEKPPLTGDRELLVTDIDVGKLEFERRRSNTWGEGAKYWSALLPYRQITIPCDSVGLEQRVILNRRLLRRIDCQPFVPTDPLTLSERCRRILDIQTIGLEQRLKGVCAATGKKEVALGISGGRDSVLALLITLRAFKRLGWSTLGIKAITLPGPGTTKGTHAVAVDLPKLLGVTFLEAEIEPIAADILRAVGHTPCWNCLQCQNVQARVRTNIIMALGFMIGTGDMSEAFKGWCTYAGDQISMYNPNCGVPKTLINFLIQQIIDDNLLGAEVSAVLREALALEITPELIKTTGEIIQKTEDEIGPYALTDFFMRAIIRDGFSPSKTFWLANLAFEDQYEPSEIMKWLKDSYRRFFGSQFKRQAVPDGPKVGTLSLDPRGDWRMPADMAMPTSWKRILDDFETKF